MIAHAAHLLSAEGPVVLTGNAHRYEHRPDPVRGCWPGAAVIASVAMPTVDDQ